MGVNKIVVNRPTGEEVLIDLTMDSVVPEKLHKGFTAHNSKGDPIIGTYEVGNGEAEFTVWEKRTIGRHVDYYSMEFGESDTTTATVTSYNDQHKRILYADYSFDEVTGVVTLSNPLSTTQTSSADQVTNYEQYPYYYGDKSNGTTDNTVYKLTSVTSSGTSSYNKSYTWEFDKAVITEHGAYDIAGDLIETIADTNSTAYPDNGVQDGYWYIKAGSGEGGSSEGGTTEVKLQSKSATPSESIQTIEPDAEYDGLSQVVIKAIPSDHVGSGVTRLGAKTYTPSDSQQTIEAGQYLEGEQTILPVPTETKTITENGTYTPDVGKFFSSVTVEVPTGGESGGTADVLTKEVTPNSNTLSVEFTGLTGEPSAFAIQPVENITLSSTRSVVSVTYDGTETEGVCGYSSGSFMSSSATNAYFASDFTWEYENGTLTVTSNSASTSGYFKSDTTYKLFYVTGGASSGGSGGGDGLPDVIVAGDTPILGSWVGSQVTATTATDTGLSVTIPQDGTYRFYIPANKGTAYGTTTNPTIQIYKNGVASGDAIEITTATPTKPYSIDLECSAGDVIKVYATAVKSNYSTTAVTVMALIACIDK